LIYNARIYTQAEGVSADSLAFNRGRIVAVGKRLQHDPEFAGYEKIDLNRRTVVPGLVDAHTHFFYFARSLSMVSLHGLTSVDACLKKIAAHAAKLKKGDWVVGEGYGPNWFVDNVQPDRYMLDSVTGGRPAFIFSKDEHSAWVNSRALNKANIGPRSLDPKGGRIERDSQGVPTGILRERPGYDPVYGMIPPLSESRIRRYWKQALEYAYSKGVTGVHSFDGPEGFEWFADLAEKDKLGLRINFYPTADLAENVVRQGVRYGAGNDWLRIAGIKVFADGSLGSITALCFDSYAGRPGDYGIEVTGVREIAGIARLAAKAGLPLAVHAIGDKAVSNVLEALESVPPLSNGARHRIEHIQLVRRKDIARIKRLGVVLSMQPCHFPLDITPIRKYWGNRSRNAYIIRTFLDKGLDMAFGSDVPIEPLDPITGIAAAVRRVRPGTSDCLHPEQRITAAEGVRAFTVGAAVAAGQAHERGYLLPGYPADFVVLSDDITKVAVTRIGQVRPLATVLDGKVKYSTDELHL